MRKTYYCEFKTWALGRFDVPWPFRIYEETPDYRMKGQVDKPLPHAKIYSAFMSFNEPTINRFLSEHVRAAIVGVILDLENHNNVLKELERIFGYCELLGIAEVTADNRSYIESKIKGAG
jgi:hypothetical protein